MREYRINIKDILNENNPTIVKKLLLEISTMLCQLKCNQLTYILKDSDNAEYAFTVYKDTYQTLNRMVAKTTTNLGEISLYY